MRTIGTMGKTEFGVFERTYDLLPSNQMGKYSKKRSLRRRRVGKATDELAERSPSVVF